MRKVVYLFGIICALTIIGACDNKERGDVNHPIKTMKTCSIGGISIGVDRGTALHHICMRANNVLSYKGGALTIYAEGDSVGYYYAPLHESFYFKHKGGKVWYVQFQSDDVVKEGYPQLLGDSINMVMQGGEKEVRFIKKCNRYTLQELPL